MMKKIILIVFLIIFAPNSFAQEEIKLDISEQIEQDAVLEEDTPYLESEVETTKMPDFTHEKFFDKLSQNTKDLYKLQIDNIDVPSSLYKETFTHKFEKGPLESVHIWNAVQMNMGTTIPEDGNVTNIFKVGLINNMIDGTFKGGKEHFRIMTDPTPQNDRPFMQNLFQDVYVATDRIPHHRILVGNSRPAVGYEGAQSSYTLPFINRSQIARHFGTVRKTGVRVIGNYPFMDYDIGGYSSGTYFREFMPGMEFDGRVDFKPLAKTNGKYGKLTVSGTLAAGSRDSSFVVAGAYVGYEYKKLWVKAEYAHANGSNGATGFSDKKRQGWNATIGYRITKKLEFVARYDEFDPDTTIGRNNQREYTAGINWYIKGQALTLILNYIFCQNSSMPDSHRILIGTQIII